MSLQGNWVDLVILIILAFYLVGGLERGFWALLAELASFIGALASALRFYPEAAKLLIVNFGLPHSFANALGFLFVAIVAELIIFSLLGKLVLARIPGKLWETGWQKMAGVLPSLANGLILVAFFLTLFTALPLRPQIKTDINNSKIGGYLVSQTVRFERQLADIFGGALRDTLTYFTIEPQSRERVSLRLEPQELKIDEQAEAQMFVLVNEERAKFGIQKLVWNPEIVVVARTHSRDMWERRYFSHINPDGEDPADRLKEGEVSFTVAGENIALAPTATLAHQGLMSSEGHRKNILDPSFRRAGIGVVDGGVYGKMVTQNFAD